MGTIERSQHDIYPFISPHAHLKHAAKGKTILITGGSKGIGKATALQFALASADAVIITARGLPSLKDTKASVQAAAPHCDIISVAADITDPASVQRLFDSLPRTPDVLVNNAGVSLSQDSIVNSDTDKWWADWEINVKGLYLCTRTYLRALAGKPGVILNVSSSVSDMVSPNLSSYATTKTAVNRFTEAVHLEHAKQGVRCIAFHPGGIAETGMGQTAPPQFRSRLYDTVDLAGGTALYLSTEPATFLSGRFVFSNWDMEQVEKLESEIESDGLLTSRIRFGDKLGMNVVPPDRA
ncbi:hypothetical protein N7G274_002480 [Stereocaulon virgatum]|uniref:Uncharacterized protein n=1 Tax=Stereocaulon virgatum TaxID=373712 RepID=A0ABR4AIM8_9LECA